MHPGEYVDQIEQLVISVFGQLVMHEMHRPVLINDFRLLAFRILTNNMLSGLDPQILFQLAVNWQTRL